MPLLLECCAEIILISQITNWNNSIRKIRLLCIYYNPSGRGQRVIAVYAVIRQGTGSSSGWLVSAPPSCKCIYTWFFENRASNTCLTFTLVGNLMPPLTENVKTHLKNKFLNTRASI